MYTPPGNKVCPGSQVWINININLINTNKRQFRDWQKTEAKGTISALSDQILDSTGIPWGKNKSWFSTYYETEVAHRVKMEKAASHTENWRDTVLMKGKDIRNLKSPTASKRQRPECLFCPHRKNTRCKGFRPKDSNHCDSPAHLQPPANQCQNYDISSYPEGQ